MTPTLGASCLAPYPHMAKPMGGVTSTFETPARKPASGPSAFAATDEHVTMIKVSPKLRWCEHRLSMAAVSSGAVEMKKKVRSGISVSSCNLSKQASIDMPEQLFRCRYSPDQHRRQPPALAGRDRPASNGSR